jgi:hypothetical protein
MKKIKAVLGRRPNYYRGQLLLEGDFLDEQTYHDAARRRHNLNLYGWGVVRGLTVSRQSDHAILINPGVAIDDLGRELFFDEPEQVNLAEFGPNAELRVALKYEEISGSEKGTAPSLTRYDCCAVVSVSRRAEDDSGVTLAIVRLDGQGTLSRTAIDDSHTPYVKIAPGSITATELHETLRKGWLRLPFRPVPLVSPPDRDEPIPPAFRVGETEARSPDPETGDEDKGAAGTMAIPIPPNVTRVTRLRIAGSRNEGKILLHLTVGGWDPDKNNHFRKIIVEEEITSEPFMETYDIEEKILDPEYQTLSLRLWGKRKTAVSLVAVEFEFVYEEARRAMPMEKMLEKPHH